MSYDKECLEVFLEKQKQLFDEPVAETLEEADAFLEDCMAMVANSVEEVREILEEEGMDVEGMEADDLLGASEVFVISSNKFLVVQG